MAPRFSRPRLISADDKQYRAFLAQIMLSKDNQRAMRPPRARDLFGNEAETALRGWLAGQLVLSDRRIVEYLEHRGRSAIKKYRELDAVVLDDRGVQVFEIKASRKAMSLRRAARQLRDTRTILEMLFGRVTTTILLVDTGIPSAAEVAAIMAGPDAPPQPPLTLDDALGLLPQVRLAGALAERDPSPEVVNLLRFSVDDIIALAGAENLHLDWEEDEEEAAEGDEPEEAEPPARFAYSTEPAEADAPEEDGGSLGDALRRALEGRGGKRR